MLIEVLVWLASAMFFFIGIYSFAVFRRERSPRAAVISISLFLGMILLISLLVLLWPEISVYIATATYGGAILLLAILFFPTGKLPHDNRRATERFDERDIMFARARYTPGDGNYERYYADNPTLKIPDDFTRHLPNLGEPGSETFDELNSPIASAIFSWLESVRHTVNGDVNAQKTEITAEEALERLSGLAKYLGAAEVGSTEVSPEHVYTHIGRGLGEWGSELDPADYPNALVFTVEMKHEMINSAPKQPVLVDSARQYLDGAVIALIIAQYIRILGYQATAHMDGNYRLIMPTLAVDAGLGEIGRHSLLITPKLGSRVRIGAVTTDMPLPQAKRIAFGVQEFCEVCKKCAVNCPPRAITEEGQTEHRGTKYWKIHENRCYRYWRGVGTDCGTCNSVCPFSRPIGPIHDFVRAACRKSAISRRIFARMDDFFYGRKPSCSVYPSWMKSGLSEKKKEKIGIK